MMRNHSGKEQEITNNVIRIIGSDGDLVGYAGGLHAKKKLLQLENLIINDQQRLF